MIDLHVHSTFSDGSLAPAELVREALKAELTALSLTDHDTLAGIPDFMAACSEVRGLTGVPGVEISAEVPVGTLHMLGYFMDAANARLNTVLEEIRDGRRLRNERILRKLNNMGVDLTWDEVARHAGEDVVGRPHFAMALLARGCVASKDEAFRCYLAKGQRAYVDRYRLSPAQSIDIIREAGGVPVLAHPFTLDLDAAALKRTVGELTAMGLQGIEVYYSEHGREQEQRYLALTREFRLVATGGSDFHGELNPEIQMGRGFGSLNVPDSVLDALRAAQVGGNTRERKP